MQNHRFSRVAGMTLLAKRSIKAKLGSSVVRSMIFEVPAACRLDDPEGARWRIEAAEDVSAALRRWAHARKVPWSYPPIAIVPRSDTKDETSLEIQWTHLR